MRPIYALCVIWYASIYAYTTMYRNEYIMLSIKR